MIIIGLVISTWLFLEATQKYIMPIAVKLCLNAAKDKANRVINESVDSVLKESGINYSDLFSVVSNNNEITMITTDTAAINTLCADISEYITKNLENMENDEMSIPYGATTGFGILSNVGPPIVFEMTPVGGADVDYETEFNSAGINQTNYKIWLTVNISVSLVNPLYNEEMSMNRKIMLVDTVINGKVPDYYYKDYQ